MLLFPGTSHPKLAAAVAKKCGLDLGKCEIKKFSGGEIYVRLLDEVRGECCWILQTSGANVSDDYLEIFLLADALRRHEAREINLIIPHFGYARQDRRAMMGEPISAQLMANLLVAAGGARGGTFDLHSDQIEGFFSVPVDNLHCFPMFAEYFLSKKLPDLVVVAPDTGAAKIVQRLSDQLCAPLAILHKTRPRHHEVSYTHVVGEIQGKTAILFDDMIDTGSTIGPAVEVLIKNGAREVYVAATHGIFSGPAYERLAACAAKEIVVTDTLPVEEGRLANLKVLSIVSLLEKIL